MDSKFYVRVRAYKKRNSGNQPLDLNSNVRPLYSPSELTLHRASCLVMVVILLVIFGRCHTVQRPPENILR
jgi:hypothetical protein